RTKNVAGSGSTIVAPVGIRTNFEQLSVVFKGSGSVAPNAHTSLGIQGVSRRPEFETRCGRLRLASWGIIEIAFRGDTQQILAHGRCEPARRRPVRRSRWNCGSGK